MRIAVERQPGPSAEGIVVVQPLFVANLVRLFAHHRENMGAVVGTYSLYGGDQLLGTGFRPWRIAARVRTRNAEFGQFVPPALGDLLLQQCLDWAGQPFDVVLQFVFIDKINPFCEQQGLYHILQRTVRVVQG